MKEKSALALIIEELPSQKNIPRDRLIQIVESAVEKAAIATSKHLGAEKNYFASYNEDTGSVDLFESRVVVEVVQDPNKEISLEQAQKEDPDFQIGDILDITQTLDSLGHIAAQNAKQHIIQQIRILEREITFETFKSKKGDVIRGIVRRFEKNNIIVDVGLTEAILPKKEQISSENYRAGDNIQAYVLDINLNAKSPQIVLSRSHSMLLVRLFEQEVPEIAEGYVQIEACARIPGQRAKIAVSSNDENVDPVGACVGLSGARVQSVVNALNGEAIDIIKYSDNPTQFVIEAIAPADVSRCFIDPESKSIELIVPDNQKSKAIGKYGQNVNLATQLTQWKIDITSESEREKRRDKAIQELSRIAELQEEDIDKLIRHKFLNLTELNDAEPEDIAVLLNIGEEQARRIIDQAEVAIVQMQEEEKERKARTQEIEEAE